MVSGVLASADIKIAFFTSVFDTVFNTTLELSYQQGDDILQSLVDAIFSNGKQGLVDGVELALTGGLSTKVEELASEALESARSEITNLPQTIKNWAMGPGKEIMEAFDDFTDWTGHHLDQAGNAIVGWADDTEDFFVEDVGGALGGAVKDVGGGLEDAGGALKDFFG